MRKKGVLFLALSFFLAMTPVLPARTEHYAKERRYASPDASASVVIWPAGKKGGAEHESKIEFRLPDGSVACTLDYASKDGEHGFVVVKAEWTADSRYFVFSLKSSGGHQSWHAPTQFWSRSDGTIRTLDDYFEAAGISDAKFRLIAPNTIKTDILRDKSIPVSVTLAELPPLRSWRKLKPFLISCTKGQTFKPDQP